MSFTHWKYSLFSVLYLSLIVKLSGVNKEICSVIVSQKILGNRNFNEMETCFYSPALIAVPRQLKLNIATNVVFFTGQLWPLVSSYATR